MSIHATKTILLGALLLAASAAQAQYAWIDEHGVRHYADQPPPPGTPASKVLKVPRGMTAAASPAATAPATATLAEREADYQKRQAATNARDKKDAVQQKTAQEKRVRCDLAAQNKAQLDTGRRLRVEGKVMTDADKAAEQARIAAVLKDCQ